jgi:hypothetical protein
MRDLTVNRFSEESPLQEDLRDRTFDFEELGTWLLTGVICVVGLLVAILQVVKVLR